MTIATMEALEALPLGETVEVRSRVIGNKTWERVGGGMKIENGQVVLGLDMFIGALGEQRVRAAAPSVPEVGGMYTSRDYADHRYTYLVVEADTETQRATCLFFRYTQFRSVRTRAFSTMKDELTFLPEEQRPEWTPVALALGKEWMDTRRVLAGFKTELREFIDRLPR